MIIPWPENKSEYACFYDRTFSMEKFKDDLDQRVQIVSLKQVHGTEIVTVTEKPLPRYLEGDALVTEEENVALTIHTADCLPILAISNGVLGACHGGWRGLSGGIIEKWIAKMVQLGAKRNAIDIAIGPSIGVCHFEVGIDVGRQIISGLNEKDISKVTARHANSEKIWVSLSGVAQAKFMKLGLDPECIKITNECTYCHPDKYFSFRRDGDKKGHRLEALVVKRPL